MIFKEKEYKILIDSLKECDTPTVDLELHNFLNSDYQDGETKKVITLPEVTSILKNESYFKLPSTNTSYKKFKTKEKNSSNQLYGIDVLSPWLYELDRKKFKIVQDNFLKNNIDLALDMQEELFKKENNNYSIKKIASDIYVNYSHQYIIYQLNNPINYKINQQAEKVFNDVTTALVNRVRKEDHVFALGLIRRSIELGEDRDKSLSWFKTFTNTNKTISQNAKKHMDWIKKEIKQWDLTKHFKINEINLLYSNNNGLLNKRVEGLFYEVDLNILKLSNKTTSDNIRTNIEILISTLDDALGNKNNYLKTIAIFKDSHVQINVLFNHSNDNNLLEIVDENIKSIINRKEKMTEMDMKDMFNSSLFSVFLDESLKDKPNSKQQKIKI